MGSMLGVRPGTTEHDNKQTYKKDANAHGQTASFDQGRANTGRSSSSPPSSSAIFFCIMVSMWLLLQGIVAFAPLKSVYAQYGQPQELPPLLDATAEELSSGLASGVFTSVDLVQVRSEYTCARYATMD